jgi:hypothetical protein
MHQKALFSVALWEPSALESLYSTLDFIPFAYAAP